MNRQLFRGAFLEMQEGYQGGHCTQSTNHLMIMYNVVLRSYNSLLLVLLHRVIKLTVILWRLYM